MKKVLLFLVLVGLVVAGRYGYVWYLESRIYTIEFVSNGGSDLMMLSVTVEEEIPTFETPTREGYFFAGWYIDSEKSELFDFDLMPKEDLVLYADWGSHDLIYTLFQGEYIISVGDSQPVDVIIPKLYNGLPVTGIGYQAFFQNNSMQSIAIPNTITSIGDQAFMLTSSLQRVEFEKGSQIPEIPTYSFFGLTNLSEIEIPASVKIIEEFAFASSSLNSITFEESSLLESIGSNAFSNMPNVTQIEIPSSLKMIGEYVFVMCPNLTSIVFQPNSELENIGSYALAGTQITEITLPNTLDSIGSYAFAGTRLTVISIPISVSTISYGAFAGTELTIIYVEASQKPDGWDVDWNPSNILVQWGSEE